MGQMDPKKLPKNFDMISYWISWTISLLVTGSNGFLQLFSLDKNYFSYSMVVEQLKTEGWQFFGLSGKYEDYPDHQSAYKTFSKSVESIKRKQVDQEFSNGKGENKKKKFDFKGEMEKFAQEQNADLKMTDVVQVDPSLVPRGLDLVPPLKMATDLATLQSTRDVVSRTMEVEVEAEKVVSDIIDKAVEKKE
jgi:hypothetical protein